MPSQPKSLTSHDILDIALADIRIPIDRALATYADESNWSQETDRKTGSCIWAWRGPSLPGFELARLALKFNNKET